MWAAFHGEALGMASLCHAAGLLGWLGTPALHAAPVPEHIVRTQRLDWQ